MVLSMFQFYGEWHQFSLRKAPVQRNSRRGWKCVMEYFFPNIHLLEQLQTSSTNAQIFESQENAH